MAKNMLQEQDTNLAVVDYIPLLKEIAKAIECHSSLFLVNSKNMQIQLDKLALVIVEKLQQTKSEAILPFTYTKGTTFSAANFANSRAFRDFRTQIDNIQGILGAKLTEAITETFKGQNNIQDIASYTQHLLSSPDSFTKDKVEKLYYPFKTPEELSKRRLHLQAREKPTNTGTRLLGHKLTITVKNVHKFNDELIEGLCTKLEDSCDCTTTELERVRAILKQRILDNESELGILKRVICVESFGRLQKEGKVLYLEYLARAMEKTDIAYTSKLDFKYLKILAKRLRMLEAFLHEERRDEDYQVSYGGYGANYRDLFARADVFDLLPIISDIEGSLGETYHQEKGEQEFIMGIKLKLNGGFRTYQSVFSYYLTLLDSQSEEHKNRKNGKGYNNQYFIERVLKIALLYYFVFRNMSDENYNPVTNVEEELLHYLRQDGDEEKKITRLHWLYTGLKGKSAACTEKLDLLKQTLEEFLRKAGSTFETWPTSVHLSLNESILDLDCQRILTEKNFLRTEALREKGMCTLKYIAIEEATAAGEALCSLPVTFTFEPMYYSSQEQDQPQQFQMEYQIPYFVFLPVLFVAGQENIYTYCCTYYQEYKHIIFSYQHQLPFLQDPAATFVYQFTYSLIAYIILRLLESSVRGPLYEQHRQLFLPLVRVHQLQRNENEKEERASTEDLLRSLTKTLAHMLNEECRSNAQGFHIDVLRGHAQGAMYMLRNGLSSLYSILPKTFHLDAEPNLDKLAIIVVSSRKCDAHKNATMHLSNIYGEVVGIRKLKNGKSVQVLTLNTFSANENSENMYHLPIVLRDQARQCYEKGYRHILFVAHAPYSSTLHLTSNHTGEEHYFMSKNIIQALKDEKDDLNIYPVYCDRFYVVKIQGETRQSLYIDDTSELRGLVSDPNRSSIVFL